jgi:hypothetical protein
MLQLEIARSAATAGLLGWTVVTGRRHRKINDRLDDLYDEQQAERLAAAGITRFELEN